MSLKSIARMALVAGTLLALTAAVDPSAPVNFTTDQALAGRKVYSEQCASCHGDTLTGGKAMALRGELFQKQWLNGRRTFENLFDTVKTSMPVGAAGSLEGESYDNVLAYILSQNGYHPTGDSLVAVEHAKTLMPPADPTPVVLAEQVMPTTPFPQVAQVFGQATSNGPDDAALLHPADTQWLMYNKDLAGQRYSALDQINRANATHLSPVCVFQPVELGFFQPAPIVDAGVMYITTPYNTFAIDAAKCTKLWEHRYPADAAVPLRVTRGAALYRGKLFRTTPNGHLIALDARTGKLLWDVWMVDKARGYWLSAAPVAYDGLVYIGPAGADWGANGFVAAFDTETGALRWRFNVIPTGKEIGAKTWQKGAERGGGSTWSTFTIDPAKGLLLAPVGNPAPDYLGAVRPGDNLFTNSVIALDLKTGKLAWWVQQVPHDTHDWDTAAAPVIFDQDGRRFMAAVNKGGWLYLYDRDTRRLLAQPEITPHENVDVPVTEEGVHHCPGLMGGAEWNGAAYSPKARALYVGTVNWCGTTHRGEDKYVEGSSYFGGVSSLDPASTARGHIHAIEAGSGKSLWVREFGNPMVAAITPTAGDVLFTGSFDGNFLVLDTATGETLYNFDTGGAIASAPSTYLVNGRQYVAVPSGNNSRTVWQTGGSMMVMIFALQQRK